MDHLRQPADEVRCGSRGRGMSWTPEREAKMRELWGQGMSASAVAAQLGPWCTRSAVLGKVHRLGLS
ncbi:MAG: hypothetical protein KGZ68_01025, partial [Dechloromonas sp.]|nr:hypothetical protein [Dechloromonas sp.]